MTYRVGERIVAALWVGSLWAIGYLVAPLLFARLDDRGLAGFLAGEFFTVITWMSLVCGGLLVVMALAEGRPRRAALPALMAVLLSASEWVVRPMMQAARLADGTPGEGFGALHAVSQVLFLLASLAGLVLLLTLESGVRKPAR